MYHAENGDHRVPAEVDLSGEVGVAGLRGRRPEDEVPNGILKF